MTPAPPILRLLMVPAAALLAIGCGGASGASKGGSCSSAEELAPPEGVDEGTAASRAVLAMGASFRGAGDLAANIAPAVSPGYQRLETGKRAKWEVAVLQVADAPRAVDVDFGDGGNARLDVVAGNGACLFEVSHTFDAPGNRRPVKFTLAGQQPFTAFVDVVAKD